MTSVRYNFLRPLLTAQPYIAGTNFEYCSKRVTHNLSTFRVDTQLKHGESLAHWQARHIGIDPDDLDLSPWLQVEPSKVSQGKVIIARSSRYHVQTFPWRHLVHQHAGKLLFVGLHDEHSAFQKSFGDIPYVPVRDALEMAQLIAGADLFIGNQSCPCWIALGVGQNLIQETFPPSPNSRIFRPNAKYVSSLNELFMNVIVPGQRVANTVTATQMLG